MGFARSRRLVRAFATLVVLGCMMAVAAPAALAQNDVVTQEDCDRGNITRNGRTLSQSECEALIGQRVRLAQTGFEAWIPVTAGVFLLAGAVALRLRSRRTGPQLA